jgi:hypothetical protein
MLVMPTSGVAMVSSLRHFRSGVTVDFGHLMARMRIVVSVL